MPACERGPVEYGERGLPAAGFQFSTRPLPEDLQPFLRKRPQIGIFRQSARGDFHGFGKPAGAAQCVGPPAVNVGVIGVEGLEIRIDHQAAVELLDGRGVQFLDAQVNGPIVQRGQQISLGNLVRAVQTQRLGVGPDGSGEVLFG